MTLRASFTACALLIAMTAPLAAQEDAGPESGLAFSAGLFDIGQSEKAVEAGLEYRFAARRVWRFDVKPAIGVSGNEDGAVWAYLGFRTDWSLGERWVLTPSFAASYYEQGDSKDLGHALEFRSGLEIARRLRNGHRLGFLLYHLSNASISADNPGEESFLLTYSLGR